MSKGRSIALIGYPEAVLEGRNDYFIETLQPYEREKLRTFKFESARNSYLAAHILIRRAVALLVGGVPDDIVLQQRCIDCGGHHGRPIVENHPHIYVSLSRRDAVVAAVASELPCSIDVESWEHSVSLMEMGVCAPSELTLLAQLQFDAAKKTSMRSCEIAALYLWARKECLIKLDRLTLDTMSTCDVVNEDLDGSIKFLPTRSNWGDLHFTEWAHYQSKTIGVVATSQDVELQFLS